MSIGVRTKMTTLQPPRERRRPRQQWRVWLLVLILASMLELTTAVVRGQNGDAIESQTRKKANNSQQNSRQPKTTVEIPTASAMVSPLWSRELLPFFVTFVGQLDDELLLLQAIETYLTEEMAVSLESLLEVQLTQTSAAMYSGRKRTRRTLEEVGTLAYAGTATFEVSSDVMLPPLNSVQTAQIVALLSRDALREFLLEEYGMDLRVEDIGSAEVTEKGEEQELENITVETLDELEEAVEEVTDDSEEGGDKKRHSLLITAFVFAGGCILILGGCVVFLLLQLKTELVRLKDSKSRKDASAKHSGEDIFDVEQQDGSHHKVEDIVGVEVRMDQVDDVEPLEDESTVATMEKWFTVLRNSVESHRTMFNNSQSTPPLQPAPRQAEPDDGDSPNPPGAKPMERVTALRALDNSGPTDHVTAPSPSMPNPNESVELSPPVYGSALPHEDESPDSSESVESSVLSDDDEAPTPPMAIQICIVPPPEESTMLSTVCSMIEEEEEESIVTNQTGSVASEEGNPKMQEGEDDDGEEEEDRDPLESLDELWDELGEILDTPSFERPPALATLSRCPSSEDETNRPAQSPAAGPQKGETVMSEEAISVLPEVDETPSPPIAMQNYTEVPQLESGMLSTVCSMIEECNESIATDATDFPASEIEATTMKEEEEEKAEKAEEEEEKEENDDLLESLDELGELLGAKSFESQPGLAILSRCHSADDETNLPPHRPAVGFRINAPTPVDNDDPENEDNDTCVAPSDGSSRSFESGSSRSFEKPEGLATRKTTTEAMGGTSNVGINEPTPHGKPSHCDASTDSESSDGKNNHHTSRHHPIKVTRIREPPVVERISYEKNHASDYDHENPLVSTDESSSDGSNDSYGFSHHAAAVDTHHTHMLDNAELMGAKKWLSSTDADQADAGSYNSDSEVMPSQHNLSSREHTRTQSVLGGRFVDSSDSSEVEDNDLLFYL